MKFGDEQMGLNVKAGITDINSGTMGTSGGLNAHAYRGVEAKGSLRQLYCNLRYC